MTPGDRDRARLPDCLGDLGPVPLDRLALLGRGGRLELAVELVDGVEVPLVDALDHPDPVGLRRGGDVGPDGAPLHGVHAVERTLQPKRVDPGQLVHGVAMGERGLGEPLVAVEHVGQPAVEAQVPAPTLQGGVELVGVALAVPPARGHRGDRALGRDRADHRADGRAEPLGPEQDRLHPAASSSSVHPPHPACT